MPSESAAKFSVGAGAPVFVAAPETAASSVTNAHGEAPALTPDDQKRFDAVATKFVQAMNSEDSTAYRALHSTEGWNSAIDWWKNMFAQQRAKFGAIVKAYPCTRGVIRFGQFGFRCTDLPNGVSFVALFEERVGGVFSFEMDSDGRISATSVFIKEELATYEPGNTPPIFSR